MKTLFLILFMVAVLPFSLISQEKNQTIFDVETNENILIGICDRNGLESGTFGAAFTDEYASYIPDNVYIQRIKGVSNDISITIVMGTWCIDSKEQVPRFFKILDMIGLDPAKIQVICVDRDKRAPGISSADLSLRLVPTFIFYRSGLEIGRIVETPQEDLEIDMLEILIR